MTHSIYWVVSRRIVGAVLDLSLFNQVTIDPEVFTIVWPNGADFDPTTLHDWPEAGLCPG